MNRLLKNLFGRGKAVVVHEPLRLSAAELQDFSNWASGSVPALMDRFIKDELFGLQAGLRPSDSVHLLSSPSSAALIVYGAEPYEPDDFRRYFHLLGDRVRQLGYRRVNADRLIEEKKSSIETRLRIYLKPCFSSSMPLDQKYGNVLLELIQVDREVQYFKLQACWYSDRSWCEALPFEELLEKIQLS
jgi:hypothetical protein